MTVVVVVKALGCDAEAFRMTVSIEVLLIGARFDVVSDTFPDEESIVGAVAVILEFSVTVECTVDTVFDVVGDLSINALTDVMLAFALRDGVEVLVDVNTKVFAASMTVLEFAAPTPSEELDC